MDTLRPTTPAAEELLGKYFPVLDHGFVALVDYMGTDACIERAARVSYGYGTREATQTRGLIRYLRRHKHTTPSEMLEFKFHCCMPMFIARQWIRHRTANVNEYSGRYSLMPMLFYTPQAEQLQYQSKANNQGRKGQVPEELYKNAVRRWNENRNKTTELYTDMTSQDVARELARIDLPLSTYTQWYWKIDLHNLLHFLTLRVNPHAQWEIQQYGQVMAGMLKRVAPLSYEAWLDYDVQGARFSRMELEILQRLISPVSEYSINSGDYPAIHPQRASDPVTFSDLEEELSKREITEFLQKLRPTKHAVDFELDLNQTEEGSYFQKRFAEAVPDVDR